MALSFTTISISYISSLLSSFFPLVVLTFEKGGKYALAANIFLFAYLFFAGVGINAAMRGEDGKGLTYDALWISGSSSVLLLICVAILIRRKIKRRARRKIEIKSEAEKT